MGRAQLAAAVLALALAGPVLGPAAAAFPADAVANAHYTARGVLLSLVALVNEVGPPLLAGVTRVPDGAADAARTLAHVLVEDAERLAAPAEDCVRAAPAGSSPWLDSASGEGLPPPAAPALPRCGPPPPAAGAGAER